jgi:CRISPR-associated exonuclease Cas4
MKISGSIIQSYIICPRQTWLMSRNICGDRYNEFLAIGRLISEKTYERNKKEIDIGSNKIDFIKKDNNSLIIVETKKSSKMIKATEAQLLFYLYSYKNRFREVSGEIRIPKEKKVIEVELTDEKIEYIKKLVEEINSVIDKESAPEKKRIKVCSSCSYLDFCWS